MVDEAHEFVPYPDLEILINDHSLPLADVEDFTTEYSVSTGASVKLTLRWGGPAAGGPEWGGPEIAVMIVIGELLRRGTSEAYNLTRAFVVDVYSRIKTRNAARWYIEGAMALAIDNEDKSVRLIFCFPEGLERNAVEERIRLVEAHQAELFDVWQKKAPAEVRLCWNEGEQIWFECEPYPEDDSPL